MKLKYRLLFAVPTISTLGFSIWGLWPQQTKVTPAPPGGGSFYSSKVEPVLNRRCVTCHSCYTAPCQMNFQSAEGTERGAFKVDVLSGPRDNGVQPTRLGVDARSRDAWRRLGFFDVLQNGVLEKLLDLKEKNPKHEADPRADRENRSCPADAAEADAYVKERPGGGMPYGLTQIAPDELGVLKKWLRLGAPVAPVEIRPTPAEMAQASEWNDFFNRSNPRSQLVSRYLYEHLFLAHLYFQEAPEHFFRLVRSRTTCDAGPEEIPTPRPNDDPGGAVFYYCLVPVTKTIVEKSHMAFDLSRSRLERWENLFFSDGWRVEHMPSYDAATAANPFIAFQDIPAEIRYRFLLDDARYHVSTFIKGPVCNGTMAVNAIQEQFYVFFLDPRADPLANRGSFAAQAKGLLVMPGGWGRDVGAAEILLRMEQSKKARDDYRTLRYQTAAKLRPGGYTLEDVWDGDGVNDNALLTVFRHDDSAYVLKGARGDLPKTAFVVDYGIFERLVYNLVVNYDAFASTGHQILTRAYMSLIRMEAEELFLAFLPKNQREPIRDSWYQGFLLTKIGVKFLNTLEPLFQETGIRFENPAEAKIEFMNRAIFERFNDKVRGTLDLINWKRIAPRAKTSSLRLPLPDGEQALFRRISAVPAASAPFSKFFPDLTLLEVVSEKGEPRKLYSIIHNKEMRNLVWWLIEEEPRRASEEDSLVILEGVAGSYPNAFIRVSENELSALVEAIASARTPEEWASVREKYGIHRMHPRFWKIYDEIQSLTDRYLRSATGILDLNRFE